MPLAIDDLAVTSATCRGEPSACAERFSQDGMLVVRDVMPAGICEALAAAAARRCQEALARPHEAWGEDFSLTIASPSNRRDMKLHLRDEAVLAAVHALLGGDARIAALLERIVRADATLCELAMLSAEFGAAQQGWHSDTLVTAGRTVVTVFVALQDTPARRGATWMRPASHRPSSRTAGDEGVTEDVAGDSEACSDSVCARPALAVELRQGDCCLMDSRLLHCGGAHSDPSLGVRRLFYLSFLIPGTTAAGSTLTLRRGYERVFVLAKWKQWADDALDLIESSASGNSADSMQFQWNGSSGVPGAKDSDAVWDARAGILSALGLERPAPSVDTSLLVPKPLFQVVSAIHSASAVEMYFGSFAAQWLHVPLPVVGEVCERILGSAAMARGQRTSLEQNAVDRLVAAANRDERFSSYARRLRDQGLIDDGVAIAYLVVLRRRSRLGGESWEQVGAALLDSTGSPTDRLLRMFDGERTMTSEQSGDVVGTRGCCWADDMAMEALESLQGPLAELAQSLRNDLDALCSSLSGAWPADAEIVSAGGSDVDHPPTMIELRWAQNLLDACRDTEFSSGESFLRRGICHAAGSRTDVFGPIDFAPSEDNLEDDPFCTERSLVMRLRGIPTEHWLRPPTRPASSTAEQPERQQSEDPRAQLFWTSLPLGGGVSPHLLRCLRVLLTQDSPLNLPVDAAPFSEEGMVALDKLCFETLLETLRSLAASARAEAAAYLEDPEQTLGESSGIPERYWRELANYHSAQAELIESNSRVLEEVLASATSLHEDGAPPAKRRHVSSRN